GEVIGAEAKTIHRLLEYQGTGFKRNEENPLKADVLIVDECSMLDISLTASLLKAVGSETALLFIGDADQLPSVGAGNVLRDLIASGSVPVHTLNTVFRQASASAIITFAHQINHGQPPKIASPFKHPEQWQHSDCLFIDSDEPTQAQLGFISKVRQHFRTLEEREAAVGGDPFAFEDAPPRYEFQVPEQFCHVDLHSLATAEGPASELAAVVKKVHPWSSLYYNLTAADVVRRLYTEWIPKYRGAGCEIQVLSPMIRGSLGTASLNKMLQQAVNPPQEGRAEITVGERLFRTGDRVIHRRNNYDLGVFNGDIGRISGVDNADMTLRVCFMDQREVEYQREQITELELAYAITIHKAQGSEFEAVIIPVMSQHYRMLFRNLIYTGLTRARKLAVFVGTRKALAMAVANRDTGLRQTALRELVGGEE
ncbi:AAA family ATPase, partial [Desulfobulbus sp. F4]|nr:AAA family ATPase [Desulfobulbus sp. F4]